MKEDDVCYLPTSMWLVVLLIDCPKAISAQETLSFIVSSSSSEEYDEDAPEEDDLPPFDLKLALPLLLYGFVFVFLAL